MTTADTTVQYSFTQHLQKNYLPVRMSEACRVLHRILGQSGLPTHLCGRSVNQTFAAAGACSW